MAVIVGSILVLAGCICAVISVVRLARANTNVVLPLFAAAPSRPISSVVFNISAVVLVIWGANIMTPQIGGWAFALLIVAVLLPFIAVRAWHNHNVSPAH